VVSAVLGIGEGKVHETRLGLDMGRFDAHLARVDGCLRALPERESAKPDDCLAVKDGLLRRCDENFGSELDACMTEAEKQPDEVKKEGDLLPGLRKLRQDLVHCYDKEGLRPLTVQQLDSPLKRCGLTHLSRVLSDLIMKGTEDHIRQFLNHRETFHKFHPHTVEGEEEDHHFYGADHVHHREMNLKGGRYELIPPADKDIAGLVSFMTTQFNTPDIATSIWGHHKEQAQLAYIVVRAQHNDTSHVVDQPWHQDRDTLEDVRVQACVHGWTSKDGPPEFFPTSHRMHNRLRPADDVYPRGRRIDKASRGDVIFYFPRLRHRGTKRTGKKVRVTLDMVLHSVGRSYHEESERHTGHHRFLSTSHNQKSHETFKEMWATRTDLNAKHPEHTEVTQEMLDRAPEHVRNPPKYEFSEL